MTTAETRPELSQERKDALYADLSVLEVNNLLEIQANYHNFAETVKPILKQGAAKLIEHGIFPEVDVANGFVDNCSTIRLCDIAYEGEGSLGRVVVDAEGKMYICEQIESGRSLGWIIDWSSRKDASDEEYVDFSLLALHAMADEFRGALGMDTESSPIPYHSRL